MTSTPGPVRGQVPFRKTVSARARFAATSWGHLGLGMALAATGAVLLLEAGPTGKSVFWWGGLVALAASLSLVISGINAFETLPESAPVPAPARRTDAPQQLPVPSLGELVVGHAGLISAQQLQEALARQKATGQPLGEVLVDLGLVTSAQLTQLLEYQARLADPWSPAD